MEIVLEVVWISMFKWLRWLGLKLGVGELDDDFLGFFVTIWVLDLRRILPEEVYLMGLGDVLLESDTWFCFPGDFFMVTERENILIVFRVMLLMLLIFL